MGHGWPGVSGIGLSEARGAVTFAEASSGLHRYASAVYSFNCFSNFAREGRSMTLSVPRKRLAMYSTVRLLFVLTAGCGPSGLAFGMTPLPLATSKCLPSVVTRTEVGYQPTGMKPSERLWPGALTSNTATMLLSALATKRVRSSGESARLLGVEPGRACG